MQAIVLPVTDRALEHAEKIAALLTEAGVRAEVDRRNEKLGFKIRESQVNKIPFALVVGDKEVESGGASLRLRSGQDLGTQPVAELVRRISDESRLPGQGTKKEQSRSE